MSDDLIDVQTVGINETFTLDFQETATLVQESFQIKIIDIIEDSRCPTEDSANCFWIGQVRATIEINIEGQLINREIMFQYGKETPLIYGEYTIKIEKVIPENQIDEVIELDEYRFEIKISK